MIQLVAFDSPSRGVAAVLILGVYNAVARARTGGIPVSPSVKRGAPRSLCRLNGLVIFAAHRKTPPIVDENGNTPKTASQSLLS